MYIKERLVFNKKSGALIGFSDLGEINNLMMEQEDLHNRISIWPLVKVTVTFMLRGLFTSLTVIYTQFPAASKGYQLFVLQWKAIERLSRLGLCVMAISCDGVSNNRKMFELHDPISGLPYKAKNVFSSSKDMIYFICDPSHLIKTIRNCFSWGHL